MEVNKILFITLSNIGDVILTLPVLDALRNRFPQAEITCLVGPRPKEIFENNPAVAKLLIYDKHAALKEKIKLFNRLKKEKFDLVVDLRNTFFGAFLPAKYKTSPFLIMPQKLRHMKERHLYRLRRLQRLREVTKVTAGGILYIPPADKEYIDGILSKNGISEKDKIALVSPGGRSHIKRWDKDKFAQLINFLKEDFSFKVVLVADAPDAPISQYIVGQSKYPILDLTAKTTIRQLAHLLKKAGLVITNDSAVLHLAGYLNRPSVAIFGPTNEEKYGPWSEDSLIVKKDIFCRPCEKAQCRFGNLACMQFIKVEDVLRKVREILNIQHPASLPVRQAGSIQHPDTFKRILIVRTDRIGDVLLSTPVIKAMRDNYPDAYIAVMTNPYAKEVVEGNPYLDEVIIYDKDGKHRRWYRSLRFALNLKKKKFDLALILHPTNRVHLVTFFAGIKRRIGYDRKMGFLLTDRIRHTKQLGEKHELEYNLDLVRCLGIEPQDKNLFMPLEPAVENWAGDFLKEQDIRETDKLLAVHPAASCPSKIWPSQRFAEAIDKLADKYGFKVLVVAGPKDINLAQKVIKHTRHPAINLAGKTSTRQLASILKRCRLFISNDSGPVHIASSVGVPVISIFGRNQKGLSPQRWGPRGAKDKFLHQEVGCIRCLAHNCTKEFACLKAITVDDVVAAADAILQS